MPKRKFYSVFIAMLASCFSVPTPQKTKKPHKCGFSENHLSRLKSKKVQLYRHGKGLERFFVV